MIFYDILWCVVIVAIVVDILFMMSSRIIFLLITIMVCSISVNRPPTAPCEANDWRAPSGANFHTVESLISAWNGDPLYHKQLLKKPPTIQGPAVFPDRNWRATKEPTTLTKRS